MDNLTHSLVGALIGQAGLKQKTGLAMAALIIGANIPDVDATCVLLGGNQHLALRRGVTHGPIAWVLLPLVLAGLLYLYDKRQARRGTRPEGRAPVHFGWLYALGFIACLTHPAMDWLNVYGVRLLEPFSHRWFYGDVLFIIDIWLWLGMGFATWFSLRREKKGGNWRRPARIALVGMLAYIGANWMITQYYQLRHRAYVPVTVIASPMPVLFWQRDVLIGGRGAWYRMGEEWRPKPCTPESVTCFGELSHPYFQSVPLAREFCKFPDPLPDSAQLKAFLFWSRAPFVERHPNGKGIVFQDARFYDPLSRGRFSVEFPDVECHPLAAG